jgi:hypothetical protein
MGISMLADSQLSMNLDINDRCFTPGKAASMGLKSFLRSILVTVTFSFTVPIVLIGLVVVSLSIVANLPWVTAAGQTAVEQVLMVLSTFGNGSPLEGAIVIGLTCSLVGALFDTYNFYYRHLRDS